MFCFYKDQDGTNDQWLHDYCRWLSIFSKERTDITVETYSYPSGFQEKMDTSYVNQLYDRFIIYIAVHGSPPGSGTL